MKKKEESGPIGSRTSLVRFHVGMDIELLIENARWIMGVLVRIAELRGVTWASVRLRRIVSCSR